jgi:hypothetical protein
MSILTNYLTGIADKLRFNLGTTGSINASQFAEKIDDVYAKSTSDFWAMVQGGVNTSTGYANRKSYNQAFMNWNATAIKPKYPVIDVVPDMRYAFYNLGNLREVDLTNWTWVERSDATFSYTFYGCRNLQSLNFGTNFNGVHPVDILHCFDGCAGLETITNINLFSLQTGKCTDAFKGCINLKNLLVIGPIFASGLSFADSPLLKGEYVEDIIQALNTDTPGKSKTITFNT